MRKVNLGRNCMKKFFLSVWLFLSVFSVAIGGGWQGSSQPQQKAQQPVPRNNNSTSPADSEYTIVTLEEYKALQKFYVGKKLKFENLTFYHFNNGNWLWACDNQGYFEYFIINLPEEKIRDILKHKNQKCVIYARVSEYDLVIETIRFL